MAAAEALMWVEKYRPRTLDELIDQHDTKEGLKNLLKEAKGLPHLLFYGPAGSGKTSAGLALARHILGKYFADYVLSLNASDERKLTDMREKVKQFARHIAADVVPFRIVVLDEADEMDRLAQPALRRIMEDYSAITRFVFICNYLSGIIEPIQSRCAIFRFVKLAEKDVTTHLAKICKREEVSYEPEALRRIYHLSDGDLRQAINLLQSCAAYGSVTAAAVEKVAGAVPQAKVSEVLALALDGKFDEARTKMVELVRVHGIPERDFLRYAYQSVYELNRTDRLGDVAEIFAKYDARLSSGSAMPEIQLAALLAELSRLGSKRSD